MPDFMQMMSMMQNSQNPMAMMQQMLGGNPMFARAMEMSQGKSPEQMQEVIRNIAQQRGIPVEQLQQMASQFGLKL